MQMLILADRQSACFYPDDLAQKMEQAARGAGHETTTITLSSDELLPCMGCFKCWVQTPGLCIYTNDAANSIAAEMFRADVVVLISEVTYGGYSFDSKSFLDRFIPNILPYFEIVVGEMHHKMRYAQMPVMASFGYGDFSEAEARIFTDLIARNAVNIRPNSSFVYTVNSLEKFGDTVDELLSALQSGVQS